MNPRPSDIPIFKMHGTGNDFIICDLRNSSYQSLYDQFISKGDRSRWAKSLCHRHLGIGADGLLILESHTSYEFAWDFYNSDGSSAEMCGNAARCVAAYVFTEQPELKTFDFLTLAGPITAIRNKVQTVTVETTPIPQEQDRKTVSVQGRNVGFRLINTGVPHSVVLCRPDEDMTSPANRDLAQHIRSHSIVGPKGSNVTFYKERAPGQIASVTFERGVEDFTLACGTGVLAAGLEYCQNHQLSRCQVSVPGGELIVQFDSSRPRLTGPAEFVARIQLADHFWRI